MSGAINKTTMSLINNAQAIIKAIEVHGPEVIERQSGQLGGSHPAFEAAALKVQLDGQRWYLGEAVRILSEREQDASEELGDNMGLREAMLEGLAVLRTDLVQARELSSGLYDAATLDAMGFSGRIPEDAPTLLLYGAAVRAGLAAQSGKPGRLGLALDMAPLVASLDQSMAQLKQAHDAQVADGREDQVARLRRDEAFAALRLIYRGAGLIVEGTLRQAGLEALADRLRPNERRAQGLEDTPVEPA